MAQSWSPETQKFSLYVSIRMTNWSKYPDNPHQTPSFCLKYVGLNCYRKNLKSALRLLRLWSRNRAISISFSLMFIYFWEREREREREKETERERRCPCEQERGRRWQLQAGTVLSVQTLRWGSNSQTMRSWPEPKSRVRCLTDWATQAPLSNLSNISKRISLK